MSIRIAGLTLCSAAMLAGCHLTPTQEQAAIVVGGSLASYAAQHNTTAAKLVANGAAICGQVNTQTGQLVENTVVAVATAAGAPATVLNQSASAVADTCAAIGLAAGPLPAGVNAATVTLVPVATVLPVVKP